MGKKKLQPGTRQHPRMGRITRAKGRCTLPYAGPNRVRFQGSRVKPASQPQKGSPRCLVG